MMCLIRKEFSSPDQGIGYKVFSETQEGLIPTLKTTKPIIFKPDEELTDQGSGFHLFLRKEGAEKYIKAFHSVSPSAASYKFHIENLVIRRVRFSEVTERGYLDSMIDTFVPGMSKEPAIRAKKVEVLS